MKAKAVTTHDAPVALVVALDGLRTRLYKDVLVPFFNAPVDNELGPAEFYVQKSDFANGGSHPLFINYNFSGVTWKEERNFEGALAKIDEILEELVGKHCKAHKVQIFVVICTSKPDGSSAKMYESEPHTIDVPASQ